MKLRPGRCVSKINSQAWSRYSVKKPRKNFIKAMPRTSLLIFNMGEDKPTYDLHFYLRTKADVQLRSNALEAARQAANKYMEKHVPSGFFMRVVPFPHNVIREKKFASGAGADRVSQGMTLSFGKPSSVAARVFKGNTVIEIKTMAKNKVFVKEALQRASSKLSGQYSILMSEDSRAAVQKIATAA
jgi:large subunit ribosomal protein L10e